MLNAWQALTITRATHSYTKQMFLEEPLFYNSFFHDMPADRCFIQRFTDKGVKSVADLLSPNGSWIGADALASLVGVRSSRIVARILCSVLWTYTQLAPAWEQDHQSNEQNAHRIPSLSTFPELVCAFSLASPLPCPPFNVGFNGLPKQKDLYLGCVKFLSQRQITQQKVRWRDLLPCSPPYFPNWKGFYHPPVPPRHGDLQWRLVHWILPSNHLLHRFSNLLVDECPFCKKSENLFHIYVECQRLAPLFILLRNCFVRFGLIFNTCVFIYGLDIPHKNSNAVLANFLLAQAKMAVYKSRKRKLDGVGVNDEDALFLFQNLVISRVKLDFAFFSVTGRLPQFESKWCIKEVICKVREECLSFCEMFCI